MKFMLSLLLLLAMVANVNAGEVAKVVVEPVAVAAAADCCCEGPLVRVVRAPFRAVRDAVKCAQQRAQQRRCCKPCCKPCEVVVVEEVKQSCVKRCRPLLNRCATRTRVVTVKKSCCK